MKSLKNTAHNTKVNAGIEMRVAKGKTSGFHHPQVFQDHLDLHKHNKEEVVKLKDRVSSYVEKLKLLAESEDKQGQEFTAQANQPSQHTKLGQVLKIYGDNQVALAALRFQYLAVIEGIKDEWKGMEANELKAISSRLDNANRSLCTWQYFDSNKEPQKAKDEDARYQVMANEIVAMVHELRVKKEQVEPQLVLRALQGQVVFFRQALMLAETAENSIRTLGPVTPAPFTGFQMPPSVAGASTGEQLHQHSGTTSTPTSNYASPHTTNPAYGSAPPPPPVYATPPPPVPSGLPRARALYPFAKTNPPELSFNAGDILTLHTTEGQWWQAELNGQTGLIPFNYVERI